MTDTSITVYLMNPAEDEIKFGPELAEGMWVLPEEPNGRMVRADTEDARIRAQRFCRVTRLRTLPSPMHNGGFKLQFIGVWVDGYQEVVATRLSEAWLVKKETKDDADTESADSEVTGEGS